MFDPTQRRISNTLNILETSLTLLDGRSFGNGAVQVQGAGLKQYFHVFPQTADNPQGGKKITLYKAI